jgi:hypothetical protein
LYCLCSPQKRKLLLLASKRKDTKYWLLVAL